MVGTGTVRYGNGKPSYFSFPTAISRPVPSSVSVPELYRPAVMAVFPFPTVSHPTVCPFPTIPVPLSAQSRLFPSHCHISDSRPIPTLGHSFSHPASHYWGRYSHSITAVFLVFPLNDHGCNWIMQLLRCKSSTYRYFRIRFVSIFPFRFLQFKYKFKLSTNHSIRQTHT